MAYVALGRWTVSTRGVEDEPKPVNEQRQEILDLLFVSPKSRTEVAAALNIKDEAARKRLERMEKDGQVLRREDGCYECVPPS